MRRSGLRQIVSGRKLLAVGIDGPLCPDLHVVNEYRASEALLSRGRFQRRGKPDPTNGGSGPLLHKEATTLARLVLSVCNVTPASYPYAIHNKTVVEAFPNAFLSVLQSENDFPSPTEVHRRRTDFLFPYTHSAIQRLMFTLLPDYELDFKVEEILGHEQVASFLCALTALCVAANRCVAVGDSESGYIVLPPLQFWGNSIDNRSRWAEDELRNNFIGVPGAVIFSDSRSWTP